MTTSTLIFGLEPRQVRILGYLAAGFDDARIAEKEALSEASVSMSVSRLYQHFHVQGVPRSTMRLNLALTWLRETGQLPTRRRKPCTCVHFHGAVLE